MTAFRKYGRNTLWAVGEKIFRMACELFVGIWIARYLGPEGYGVLSFSLSIALIAFTFSKLGLDSIVVKELLRESGDFGSIIANALVLKLLASLLVYFAVGITSVWMIEDEVTIKITLIVSAVMLFHPLDVFDFFFQSAVKMKYTAIARTVSLSIVSLFKIYLLLIGASIYFFAGMVLLEAIISGFLLTVIYAVKCGKLGFNINAGVIFRLVQCSWPLMLSGVLVSLYMRIDQVMLKSMSDYEAVGQYAAAIKISEAWYFLPVVINNALFPMLLKSKAKGGEHYDGIVTALYSSMIWLAIFIAVPTSILAPWLILNVYGDNYIDAASILVVHIWAGVFAYLGVAYTKYLVAEGLNKKIMQRSLFGLSLNVFLNFIFIPKMGGVGAAYATLLGQASANYLYDFFDKDVRGQVRLKNKALSPVSSYKFLKSYFYNK